MSLEFQHERLCVITYQIAHSDIERRLQNQPECELVSRSFVNDGLDIGQCRAISCFTFLVGIHPFHEISLFLLLAADDVQLFKGLLLTDPFFPSVGRTCILVRILKTYGRISLHALLHYALSQCPGCDADILFADHLLQH